MNKIRLKGNLSHSHGTVISGSHVQVGDLMEAAHREGEYMTYSWGEKRCLREEQWAFRFSEIKTITSNIEISKSVLTHIELGSSLAHELWIAWDANDEEECESILEKATNERLEG